MAECLRRPRRRLESARVLPATPAAAVFAGVLREFHDLLIEEPRAEAAHAIAKQRREAV